MPGAYQLPLALFAQRCLGRMAVGPPRAASVSVCRGDSSTMGPGWWQWQCHSSVPAVGPGEGASGAADSGGQVALSPVVLCLARGWGTRLSAEGQLSPRGQGQFCGSRLGATISPTNRGQGSSGAGAACPQGQSASATLLGSPNKGCSGVLGGWALCQAASHPTCILQYGLSRVFPRIPRGLSCVP